MTISQFVVKGAVNPLLYGKQIPSPDLDTYLPPRTELYGDQSWENVVLHEYWEAKLVWAYRKVQS